MPKIEICRLVVQGHEDEGDFSRARYALKTQGRMLPVVLCFDSMDDASDWLDWAQSRARVDSLPSCAIEDLAEDWHRLRAEANQEHIDMGGED